MDRYSCMCLLLLRERSLFATLLFLLSYWIPFFSLRVSPLQFFLTPFVSAVPFGPVRSYPRPLFVGFAVVPSSPVLPPFRFGLFGTLFTAMPRVVTLSLAVVVGSERSRFVVGTVCSGGSVGGTGNLTPKLFLGTSCLFISLF
ncbi:putative transmembrane protein [Toxoplasma gondii MAS]|uniref:Putative transmembrane protein n=1 Tax=Toxoplasma gondii MAS TaxID=943118 RepID=A0A086QUV7_TOXGO|nr:putative transmembrane protein [Toxoplasma gondii MAS]